MPISHGDTLPEATLVKMGAEGPTPVKMSDPNETLYWMGI